MLRCTGLKAEDSRGSTCDFSQAPSSSEGHDNGSDQGSSEHAHREEHPACSLT